MGNDPVNFVDPSGLNKEGSSCGAGKVWTDYGDGAGLICDDVIEISTWVWGGTSAPFNPTFIGPDVGFDSGNTGRWNPPDIDGGGYGPLRPDVSDRDTFAVNSALGACGAAASIGEYSTVNPSKTMWRGNNGRWAPMSWPGNQYNGSRSAAVGRANAAGLLGRMTGAVGIGFSAYQGYEALGRREYGEAGKSGADMVMGGVGIFGGFPGAVASGVYFGVDTTVGWGNVGSFLANPPPMQGCGYANAKVGTIPP